MDIRGRRPEDIELNFGPRLCALPYKRDHEHMKLAKV